MSTYTFTTKPVDTSGMYFCGFLPHQTLPEVLMCFAQGQFPGVHRPELGLTEDYVGFECSETGEQFYVYARNHLLRVAGHNVSSPVMQHLLHHIRTTVDRYRLRPRFRITD
jgi:hypothetical protein